MTGHNSHSCITHPPLLILAIIARLVLQDHNVAMTAETTTELAEFSSLHLAFTTALLHWFLAPQPPSLHIYLAI